LITIDSSGSSRQWDLPSDPRPAEDLTALARLFAGDTVTPPGRSSAVQAETPQALWQRLRVKYPSDFATSPADRATWHEFQAESAEAQAQAAENPKQVWYTAKFHWERLLALRPGDLDVMQRLAHATEQFQNVP
jgi:hypothetical protein